MDKQQENSICASFSDFCSLNQRTQNNRQNLLIKQNQRLRKQLSQVSERYINICNEATKMQQKLVEKEKKTNQLDLFYKKEIQVLKKQITNKSNQIVKLLKGKVSKINAQKQNEDCNQNLNNSQFCIQNSSSLMKTTQKQNNKLKKILHEAFQLFEPYINRTQNDETKRRIQLLKKQLDEKTNTNAMIEKASALLQQTKVRGPEQSQSEFGLILASLKSKCKQLKMTPLTFDYDLETQSKNVQVLFADIDIQMRLAKNKKSQYKQS